MRIGSIYVVSPDYGTLSVVLDDGTKLELTCTSAECAEVHELARQIYINRQVELAKQVSVIPPSNRLEAPKVEGDYADFTPVDLSDDVPF